MPEQLELRPYQDDGVDFLVSQKRVILADEMGVGKTPQALTAWVKTGCKGPAILLARKNAQSTWCIQTEQFGFQVPYVIDGTKEERQEAWSDVDEYSFVTTTIEAFNRDVRSGIAPKKWGTIFIDEFQKLGLNRSGSVNKQTQSFETLKQLVTTEYLFMLSGSPMRRGFQNLWAPLHLCDKKRWSSYWKFLQSYGYMQVNEHGAWEILGLRDQQGLAEAIKPYYLRREKKDVLPWLPAKNRVLDHVLTLSKSQQKLYDQMEQDLYVELSDGSIFASQTVMTKILRLRQLLCTPKLLDEAFEYGACLEHLGELLDETDDHHFIVFTPFTKAIPHIADYLIRHHNIKNVDWLQGGLEVQDVMGRIKHFRESQGVCICSIDYAESFDLVPATWSYFNGYSWDAMQNMQAEDRTHRFTTTEPVWYYYPQHESCIDKELMMDALDEKANEIQKVNRSTARLRRYIEQARAGSSSSLSRSS